MAKIYKVNFKQKQKELSEKNKENNALLNSVIGDNAQQNDVEQTIQFPLPSIRKEKYVREAVDCFNGGYMIRAIDLLNKVVKIDSMKNYSTMPSISLLGCAHLALNNFEFAEKYLVKGLSMARRQEKNEFLFLLKVFNLTKNTKSLNCLKDYMLNHFKDLPDIWQFSERKEKNDSEYDFEFYSLLHDFLYIVTSNEDFVFHKHIFELLQILDSENPYLVYIEQKALKGQMQKFPFEYTKGRIRERVCEIESFINSNENNLKVNTKGIIRFLVECCTPSKIRKIAPKLIGKLPANIAWQCQDVMFEPEYDEQKLSLFHSYLLHCDRNSLNIYYSRKLIMLNSSFLELIIDKEKQSANEIKIREAYACAFCDLVRIIAFNDSTEFCYQIKKAASINLFTNAIKEQNIKKIAKLSKDKINLCFLIKLLEIHKLPLSKTLNDFAKENLSKLNYFNYLDNLFGDNVVIFDGKTAKMANSGDIFTISCSIENQNSDCEKVNCEQNSVSKTNVKQNKNSKKEEKEQIQKGVKTDKSGKKQSADKNKKDKKSDKTKTSEKVKK